MHGKPSNLTPESYNEKIEELVALKSALARTDAVEKFDVNHDENGRIRGRVSLRHTESFLAFNDLIHDHPVRIAGVYSDDKLERTADGGHREVVAVKVMLTEA